MQRRWYQGLLVLGLVLVGSASTALHPPPAGATGVPFSVLTLSYQDSHGPGTISFTNEGSDAATGGSLLGVTVTQAGRSLQGQGFAQQSAAYALAFWLRDGTEDTFFFEGVLSLALNRWSAEGSWQDIQAPQHTDQWTAAPPVPPAAAVQPGYSASALKWSPADTRASGT